MSEQLQDSLDFSGRNVGRQFRKLLVPTLWGMLFGMLFNIVDGMFVGRFVGPDGLAAINIAAPMFMVCVGVALMLGMGGSVIASICLARGKERSARVVATQSLLATTVILLAVSALVLVFEEPVLRLFGCTDRLMEPAKQYLTIYVPVLALYGVFIAGGFFIRLSGDPKLEMAISVSTSILNMILDAVFIVLLKGGVQGAAIATAISMAIAGLLTVVYIFHPRVRLRMIRLKWHWRALKHGFSSVGYMCHLGFPTFLGEIATAFMMVCGNRVFVGLAAETGVAAFSVVCYLTPVVFMVYAAICQSAQPIISYNYGARRYDLMRKMFKISLGTALVYAGLLLICAELFAPGVVSLFLHPGDAAYPLAVRGVRLYSLLLFPLAINLVFVCISQSIERAKRASVVSVLRGYAFVLLTFLALPPVLGIDGAWLAVPVSEALTFLVVLALQALRRFR